MLIKPSIIAFLACLDIKRAKQFYMNTLGLKLVSEDDFAIEFDGGGVSLRITPVDKFNPHPFTVLSFKIEDIDSQVKNLTEQGVVFERYNSLKQDKLAVWKAPGNAKIAWFKDPDGNLLSLSQFP